MEVDFSVKEYNYDLRDGNLDREAKGVVKSKKNFPFFIEDGKKVIFKPLSKTKPFSTPYFAYSEVVWSTILNNYFDKSIPIYHLARCNGYQNEVPKYHDYGTVVESLVNGDEKLVNLYEYFKKHPDTKVKIDDYINYCLMYYDYSFFFDTDLFRNNPHIGKEIARQYLYSVLRADQNYHYENVSFVYDKSEIKEVAKPIDHEFSTMFMYLDQNDKHQELYKEYINAMTVNIKDFDDTMRLLFESLPEDKKYLLTSTILNNINKIVKLYPDLVEEFSSCLDLLINDLQERPIILENHFFLEPFSSDDYKEGILRFKENKPDEANKVLETLERKNVGPCEISQKINEEILDVAKTLRKKLNNN